MTTQTPGAAEGRTRFRRSRAGAALVAALATFAGPALAGGAGAAGRPIAPLSGSTPSNVEQASRTTSPQAGAFVQPAAYPQPARAGSVPSPDYKLLKLDGSLVKWGAASIGSGARITYAFLETPVQDGQARNCRSMTGLSGLAARSGLTAETVQGAARQAFSRWEAVADVTFEEIADPARADILLGAQTLPRGYAFANVRPVAQDTKELALRSRSDARTDVDAERGVAASAAQPGVSVSLIARSAVCLNPAHRWKLGYDGDLAAYDLVHTFTHEIGHAIGLDHPARRGALMHFKYTEASVGLQAGDVAGAVALYGAARTRIGRTD